MTGTAPSPAGGVEPVAAVAPDRENPNPWSVETMRTTNATYRLRACDCRRGAPMGRGDVMPDDLSAPVRLSVARLRWVDGDHDEGGAYWGRRPGENIYRAVGESAGTAVEVFVRATDRDDAKRRILARLPGATFYR